MGQNLRRQWITVSELNPQKREIIRGYQVADHVVAADAPDLEQQLLDISGGRL